MRDRPLIPPIEDAQRGFPHNIHGFLERVKNISNLNEDLAAVSAEEAPEEYNRIVQEIVSATQEYYQYIGRLPERDRRSIMDVGVESGKIKPDGSVQAHTLDPEWIEALQSASHSLLAVQAIRPKNYIMQIDAITNQLANLGAENQLKVGRRGNQPVLTTVTLDMPYHMQIEGGGQLSTYDKSIINGVTSLLESGNTVFSIPMLYHAMTGRQNPTVDEGLYDEIATKLEKMRRMILTIDLTEESEARFITAEDGTLTEVKDLALEGYLLPLNRVSGKINGKQTYLYQIIQHPPLYTYSKMRRQLASVKISLLGAPVNNNSTTIPLKTYLLQRIELMKNKKNRMDQSNILYSTIYRELGAEEAGKTRKMRIRTYTTTILQYFVEQGYIASYAEYRAGRSIAGVRICLSHSTS